MPTRKQNLYGPQIGLVIFLFLTAMFFADAANTIYSSIAGIVFVVWFLISILTKGSGGLRFFYATKAFALLVFFSLFGTVLHPGVGLTVWTFVQIFILFVCVSNLAFLAKNLSIVENGILAIGAYDVYLSMNSADITLLINSGVRLTGTFGNANMYAFFLIIALMFCVKIFLIDGKEKFSSRTVWTLLVSPFIIAGIISSGSRKGVILLFMIFLAYFSLILRKGIMGKHLFKRVIVLLMSAAAVFFIIKAVTTNDVVAKRMEGLVGFFSSDEIVYDGSMRTRAEMIARAIDLWREKPILGWGFDGFRLESSFNVYAHNNYVELLCNMGLVGFVIYYSIFLHLLLAFLKKPQQVNNKQLCFWGLSFVFMLLFFETAAVTITNKFSWFIIAYLTGVSESWENELDAPEKLRRNSSRLWIRFERRRPGSG